jgi:hypothetical protein
MGSETNSPNELTISHEGDVLARTSAAEAPFLLGGKVTGSVVGWRMTAQGMIPMTEAEFLSRTDRK